jgi:hypothetical protein
MLLLRRAAAALILLRACARLFQSVHNSFSSLTWYFVSKLRFVCRHCAAAAAAAGSELDGMRMQLLHHACTADLVLDLHCCFDASRHLFTLPSQAERFKSLASRLHCTALLTADVSGGNSFDEACSLPWLDLARRYPHSGLDDEICAACASDIENVSFFYARLKGASRSAHALPLYPHPRHRRAGRHARH